MAAAFSHASELSDVSFLAFPSVKDRLCLTDLLFLFFWSPYLAKNAKTWKDYVDSTAKSILLVQMHLLFYKSSLYPCSFLFLFRPRIKHSEDRFAFSQFYFNLTYCYRFQEHYLLSSGPLVAASFIVKADLAISQLALTFDVKKMKSKLLLFVLKIDCFIIHR